MQTRHSYSRIARIPVLLSILILFPFGQVHTQRSRVVREVSADSLMLSLKELTGALPVRVDGRVDTITTRMVLTTGNRLASQYIAERMASMGLEVDRVHFPAEDHNSWEYDANVLFTGLARIPNATTVWMCSDFGEVFTSHDGGLTWKSRLRSRVPGKDRLDWIAPLSNSVIVAMGRSGRMVMTEDGGESWSSWSSGLSATSSFACTGGGAVVALQEDGSITRSTDFGHVWATLSIDANVKAVSVAAQGSRLLIAGIDTSQSGQTGVLLESVDGGTTWASIGPDWFGPISAICAYDAQHIWLGTTGGEIYRTASGGSQWAAAPFAGPAEEAQRIVFTDQLHGWVLTAARQLFRTTDGGASWASAGLPPEPVQIRDILFIGSNEGVLVGHDRSSVITTDGGLTWTDRTTPLMSNVVATLRGSSRPGQYILVAAHSDCGPLFLGDLHWLFAPGADDDGTGTVALIELARAFAKHPLPVSLKFAAVPDEENTSNGAQYYVDELLAGPDTLILALDLDMIGYYPEQLEGVQMLLSLDSLASWCSRRMQALCYDESVPMLVIPNQGGLANTGDLSTRGETVVGIIEPIYRGVINPNYHQPTDTWETIDAEYFGNVTRAVAGLIYDACVPGSKISADPPVVDFGRRWVGLPGPPRTVAVRNDMGDGPIVVTGLSSPDSRMRIESPPATSFVIPSAGSVDVSVVFEPTSPGLADAFLVVQNDDPSLPVLNVRLQGVAIPWTAPAPYTTYAASDTMYIVDPVSGAASRLGPLGVTYLLALTVDPHGSGLWGTVPRDQISTNLVRISASGGEGLVEMRLPLPMLRAIAFSDVERTIVVGTQTGSLYRVSIATGDTLLIGQAPGVQYAGFARHPQTGDLWALAGRMLLKVNTSNGDTTLVVRQTDKSLMAIAFDDAGRLYGLTGLSARTLVSVDTTNGVTTAIGLLGATKVSALTISWGPTQDVPTGSPSVPAQYSLFQNYPNPFNPSTTIRYALPRREHVTLTVFNTLGEKLAELVNGEVGPGLHEVQVDGRGLASGVYIYRLKAGEFIQSHKCIFVR